MVKKKKKVLLWSEYLSEKSVTNGSLEKQMYLNTFPKNTFYIYKIGLQRTVVKEVLKDHEDSPFIFESIIRNLIYHIPNDKSVWREVPSTKYTTLPFIGRA